MWVPSLGQEDPLQKGMATLQNSCLENPMDRGAWRATVHGAAQSDVTEATQHTHGHRKMVLGGGRGKGDDGSCHEAGEA